MQVLGKTLRCFSVILAFSKSLHESCRLFAFYRRAADFFLFTGGLPRFDSTIGSAQGAPRIDVGDTIKGGGGGAGNFGIATMPRVKSDSKYNVWRDFAVGGCAKFQIFRIYDSFWTLHA